MSNRRSLIAVLLAAVVLAGCGGGDDAPQTKEGFISAADSVCEDIFSEFARGSSDELATAKAVAAANDELADTYAKLADRLDGVPLPATGAARTGAQAFVTSIRAAQPRLAQVRAASERFVAAEESENVAALTKSGNDVRAALDAFRLARADSDRLAIAYGLNFCGNLG